MKFCPSTLNGLREILHPLHYNEHGPLMRKILQAAIQNYSWLRFSYEELSIMERDWLASQGFTVHYTGKEFIDVMW